MKGNRGEISIMLIIVVIVLIILGGICIFMLTGENGLFVPINYEQNTETTNNTTNTNSTENEIINNATQNENGALAVPAQ